jgi:hypothetical protein
MVVPVVVVFGVLLAIAHHAAQVEGFLIALAVMALILGIEIPLITRASRRRQERRLADMAPGVFYVGPARLPAAQGSRLTEGTVELAAQGLQFMPRRASGRSLKIEWSRVASFELAPAGGRPMLGVLALQLADGGSQRVLIPQFDRLVKILEPTASRGIGGNGIR